jgi:hypothetical protein
MVLRFLIVKKIAQQEDWEEDDWDPWSLRQSDKDKLNKIKEIIKNKKSEKAIKIHLSRKPISSVTCKTKEQEIDQKPKGIWYDCNGQWIDFAETDYHDAIKSMNYIYEVIPKEKNIKTIRNEEDIIQFTKQYGIWEDYRTGRYVSKSYVDLEKEINDNSLLKYIDIEKLNFNKIDWPRLASEFCGIEICPYRGESRMEDFTYWYYGWDIASGCIWSPCGLEINLLGTTVNTIDPEERVEEQTTAKNWYLTYKMAKNGKRIRK